MTLRSITFTKDLFFHSRLTLCEKHFLFWILGNSFLGPQVHIADSNQHQYVLKIFHKKNQNKFQLKEIFNQTHFWIEYNI